MERSLITLSCENLNYKLTSKLNLKFTAHKNPASMKDVYFEIN